MAMATIKNPFGLSESTYTAVVKWFEKSYPGWEWMIVTNWPHSRGNWLLKLWNRQHRLQATYTVTDLEQELPLTTILKHFMAKMPLGGRLQNEVNKETE